MLFKKKKASACCTLQYFTQHSHITRKMSTFFGCRSWLHPLCAVCLHYGQIWKTSSKNCFFFKARKGPFIWQHDNFIKFGTHPSIFMDPFLRIWSDTIRYSLIHQFSKSQFKYSQFKIFLSGSNDGVAYMKMYLCFKIPYSREH